MTNKIIPPPSVGLKPNLTAACGLAFSSNGKKRPYAYVTDSKPRNDLGIIRTGGA